MQTMNKILIASLLLAGFNGMADEFNDDHPLSWIESSRDKARVLRYAAMGTPSPVPSEKCSTEFPLSLGANLGTDPVCVRIHELPSDVVSEIETMAAERFLNFSDYDQRVTKLYVFERTPDESLSVNAEDIRQIAAQLNIPKSYVRNVRFSNPSPSSSAYLNSLRSVYRGDQFVEDSAAYSYVSSLLAGHSLISVSFGPDEISLYPGGGFGIRFDLYISDRYLVYSKVEGWNS